MLIVQILHNCLSCIMLFNRCSFALFWSCYFWGEASKALMLHTPTLLQRHFFLLCVCRQRSDTKADPFSHKTINHCISFFKLQVRDSEEAELHIKYTVQHFFRIKVYTQSSTLMKESAYFCGSWIYLTCE